MEGWLVVNSFMNKNKFVHLYEMLSIAFKKRGVSLLIKKAQDISLDVDLKINHKPDFVLFWDKDIYLAKRLENQGLRLFNCSESINLCDNKILMYQALNEAGIRIPKTYIAPKTFEGLGYHQLDFLTKTINDLGLPLVIKEAYGSFGEQVYLANNIEEAKAIISSLGYKDFLMQEYIINSKGRDVRINIVNNQAIVSMLRENKNNFRSNISNGGTGKLYQPDQSFIDLAIKAHHALKLDFSGVDVLFGQDGPLICEVNSNPQFKSTLDTTGVNLADYIANDIINKIC